MLMMSGKSRKCRNDDSKIMFLFAIGRSSGMGYSNAPCPLKYTSESGKIPYLGKVSSRGPVTRSTISSILENISSGQCLLSDSGLLTPHETAPKAISTA